MKKYQKTTARLSVKFVKLSNNQVVLTIPSDSMEVYQFFQNNVVDQHMSQAYGDKVESIGSVKIVVEQEFLLK